MWSMRRNREVQDPHMTRLQSLITTLISNPNAAKSTLTSFEAGRAAKMGETSTWFFRLFSSSKVRLC